MSMRRPIHEPSTTSRPSDQEAPDGGETLLPQCVVVIGTGRSGTTWLGELLDHSPDVSYKYEPFSLIKKTPYNQWIQQLGTIDRARSVQDFLTIVDRAEHSIDRPPPVEKHFGHRFRRCERVIHAAGYRVPLAGRLLGLCGPLGGNEAACLAIKDVALLPWQLRDVQETLDASVLHILRNPLSVVSSSLRGRELGVFLGDRDLEQRRSRLRAFRRALPDRSWPEQMHRLDELDAIELEAMRWRLDTEITSEVLEDVPKALTLVFEECVVDRDRTAGNVCDFLGWKPDALGSAAVEREQEEGGYYSTNKDPVAVIASWQDDLTPEQVATVAGIVCESPSMAHWPELQVVLEKHR